MVPEERNGHAAVPDMTLIENTFLTHFDRMRSSDNILGRMLTHADRGAEMTKRIIREHDVRTPHDNPDARQLSGGNLQKFIMGRMLVTKPRLAIIAQPTWGVDVGAATLIKRSLLQLAEQGCGIILISQDLEEIFSLSDRIAVLHEGHMSKTYAATSLTTEDVGLLMGSADTHGGKEKSGAA
jgi:simple sugar transport system ATP-binding protein